MRFTLSKSEILRGYKSFTRVITTGNSISAPPIRCHYTRAEGRPPRILVGFSVSRNFRRAVDRNRAKRLMRESYRLSKDQLSNWSTRQNESLEVVFMYVGNHNVPPSRETLKEVSEAMKKLISGISSIIEQR